MAQRRMFSKTITNSSRFLRMPATCRLLYYDLGMNSDDNGFSEWFVILQMTGAKEQDLQVLQANEFVKIFDDKVLIISDWYEHNHIQKDRYKKSKYLELYKDRMPLCTQNGYKMYTQVRLGKDSKVEKGNTEREHPYKKEEGLKKIGEYDFKEFLEDI